MLEGSGAGVTPALHVGYLLPELRPRSPDPRRSKSPDSYLFL